MGGAMTKLETFEERDLEAEVRRIRSRWPTVGLAVSVVRDGAPPVFAGHGLADIASSAPITEDTVFRIASITKTLTAIAVLQLWEEGLVDLDAPADEYLRAYRLVPARAGFGPVTVRHLLTHTSGIRELLHPWGLLRMRDLGETVRFGRPVPTLAGYYGGALRYDAEPGTRFMYSDHGFATLGQIVEDVTGESLDRRFRERIFEPLGMTRSRLVRSERSGVGSATPYELRRRGAEVVPDYELITYPGGGARSTPRDMARYVAALFGGGAGEHGVVLKPETLAMMFEPHYRPDPRVPGMGLGFFRADLGGRLGIEHEGILPGFDSQMFLAPGEGVGVVAFANGARRGMHWLAPEVSGLVRRLLGLADEVPRADVPNRPEIWGALCGWYRFSASRLDPAKLFIGWGAQVLVRRGGLMLRFLSPVPALSRGFVLHPVDAEDPDVFRISSFAFGQGARVVFTRTPGRAATALHLDPGMVSFRRIGPSATR